MTKKGRKESREQRESKSNPMTKLGEKRESSSEEKVQDGRKGIEPQPYPRKEPRERRELNPNPMTKLGEKGGESTGGK